MKTIEERVNQWAVVPLSDADRRNLMRMALIELADDLNAEKEKEVAELKTAIQELSNSKVAGDQLNAKYIKQIAEQSTLPPRINAQAFWCDNRHVVDYETAFEIEKELLAELTATRSLLDEVKRVLGDLTNRLGHSLTGDLDGAVEQELTEVKETVDQLLTRLLP